MQFSPTTLALALALLTPMVIAIPTPIDMAVRDGLVKRDCWLGNGANVCSQCISLQSASCPFFGGSTCAAGAESACEYGGCC
ncbi:hypothetical protein V496_06691 [Pseudogymnoascus sp. VKM F-4515 (FW-2607)]|nr:hypothetical protein V496_06691 [Pseudogymnoascus sp. VKM F-4515 (FW-2607)]